MPAVSDAGPGGAPTESSWIWRTLGLGHGEVRGGGGVTVVVLELDRRAIVERGVQAFGVEPVDPGGGLPFDLVASGPGPLTVDQFGLVEPDGRLHQRVVQ